jgi:hypothetical protein
MFKQFFKFELMEESVSLVQSSDVEARCFVQALVWYKPWVVARNFRFSQFCQFSIEDALAMEAVVGYEEFLLDFLWVGSHH